MSNSTEIETLSRLFDLAARYNLEELEVEEGGLKVTLRAEVSNEDELSEGSGSLSRIWRIPGGDLVGWKPVTNGGTERSETAVPLEAPLTGIFYRSEKPEIPPFVEVGDTVEEGQTIGLIEAMKVYTPIPAECAGKVVEIVAPNGRLIEHGEPLLYIEPVTAA